MPDAPDPVLGIHHVTAIVAQPQPTIEFYTRLLGLRMVKLSVNFDDPGSYHLYFGDRTGRPGTAITFFPWIRAPRGRPGIGQIVATAYAVPPDSLDWWAQRFQQQGVVFELGTRLGQETLTLHDPDDLRIDLIASPELPEAEPWEQSTVPVQHAIHGFHSVTIAVSDHDRSAAFLSKQFGFQEAGRESGRVRLATGDGGPGKLIDLQTARQGAAADEAVMGPGAVHHVAWRVLSDEHQQAWQQWLQQEGFRVTPVKDRNYFRSIYFREPSGVIFEIATDGPGMTVDEAEADLGSELQLPPAFRNMRDQIIENLPGLELPVPRRRKPT